MARALKVYRTAIGFHDAYVAAPSKKAALRAWDTEKDLFARGAAEIVTDATLTKAPLADPGKVIKRIRGDLDDHLAAAGPLPTGRKRPEPKHEKVAATRTKPKPKPRPSREAVDDAEQEISVFESQSAQEMAEIRDKEAALHKERETLECRHRSQSEKLASRLERAETRYREAMERWRAD